MLAHSAIMWKDDNRPWARMHLMWVSVECIVPLGYFIIVVNVHLYYAVSTTLAPHSARSI